VHSGEAPARSVLNRSWANPVWKKFAGVTAVLAAIVFAGHWYVESQRYHPVVRVNMVGGLTIAALLPETKNRQTCGSASERFLTPFRQCKDCKIVEARCERDLDGIELALQRGVPLPYPTVVAREARIAVMGPPELAELSCRATAEAMVAKGLRSATCIPARAAARP
jgi:hypothetical protein